MIQLGLLLMCVAVAASSSCVVVRDAASAQDVKIEVHGANAVRVRAVTLGGKFVDAPDVVSAFTPLPGTATVTATPTVADGADCTAVDLGAAGSSVISGNLKAALGPVTNSPHPYSFCHLEDTLMGAPLFERRYSTVLPHALHQCPLGGRQQATSATLC